MKKVMIAAILLSLNTLSIPHSFADDKKNAPAAPTQEQRKKMAAVHQKMADCLKSDKPIAECKSEMMKSCREEMMSQGGCPMMGKMGGHMGGMMGHDADEDHDQ